MLYRRSRNRDLSWISVFLDPYKCRRRAKNIAYVGWEREEKSGKKEWANQNASNPKLRIFRIFPKANEKIKNLNKTYHRHLLGSFHWLPSYLLLKKTVSVFLLDLSTFLLLPVDEKISYCMKGNLPWQPQLWRQQERHKFALLTMKNNSFARFARAFFHFSTFRRLSRPFHDVKWTVLQLCRRREHKMTIVQFCFLVSEALVPI